MPSVAHWKASYYCNTKRSWIYGKFQVFPQFIQFCEDAKCDIIDFKIYFDEFVEIKKETTNVFYTALTIRVNNSKFWFSSFPSCTHVYNMLEHFWKERLFAGSIPSSSSQTNSRGRQLLRILHDSADCLSSTTKTLETQGQQIDNACRTMNKIHNDLGIAEKILHSMDSWLNHWSVSFDDVIINVSTAPGSSEKLELPVLYAANEKDKHVSGSLVLSKKDIEILDLQRAPVHSFNGREISEATFHTPYEVTLVKSEIGKPVVCVHLISARLIQVIPHIKAMLGPKLILENSSDEIRTDGQNELMQNLKLDSINKQNSEAQGTSQQGSQSVSDAEASQMTKLLQDMKSMAVGIKGEQGRQLQQLDLLANSVDKANERLRKNNRTINHLT